MPRRGFRRLTARFVGLMRIIQERIPRNRFGNSCHVVRLRLLILPMHSGTVVAVQ